MSVILNGHVGYLTGPGAVVSFTQPSYAAFSATGKGSAPSSERSEPLLAPLLTRLNVAPWGEDNRFPQNIAAQLDYCGIAKAGLDWKARALWGNGMLWGKAVDYNDDGSEVWKPIKPGEQKELRAFLRDNGNLARFYLEFLQDWVHFGNCFVELVLSNDGKKICRLIHQESSDCRFQQMDDQGRIRYVLLSKFWGQISDQFVKFNKKAAFATATVGVRGISNSAPTLIDNQYVKQRRCLDPYNALEDLREAVAEGHRNVILPVQYPSPNKTYYQLPFWDGARAAGWIEIAAKIPAMLKAMYENAFNLKYHIEIPEVYMEKRFPNGEWNKFDGKEKEIKRRELLKQMNEFLTGADNAFKSFVTFFDVSGDGAHEYARVKITAIENKNAIDKELIASSGVNGEILTAMQVPPFIMGAGTAGSGNQSAGSGSNIREGYLVYTSLLNLERNIITEPVDLVRDYNGYDEDLTCRFRDVILTTLDKNTGSVKKVS